MRVIILLSLPLAGFCLVKSPSGATTKEVALTMRPSSDSPTTKPVEIALDPEFKEINNARVFKVRMPRALRRKKVQISLKELVRPEDIAKVLVKKVSPEILEVHLPLKGYDWPVQGSPTLLEDGQLVFRTSLEGLNDIDVGSVRKSRN